MMYFSQKLNNNDMQVIINKGCQFSLIDGVYKPTIEAERIVANASNGIIKVNTEHTLMAEIW